MADKLHNRIKDVLRGIDPADFTDESKVFDFVRSQIPEATDEDIARGAQDLAGEVAETREVYEAKALALQLLGELQAIWPPDATATEVLDAELRIGNPKAKECLDALVLVFLWEVR